MTSAFWKILWPVTKCKQHSVNTQRTLQLSIVRPEQQNFKSMWMIGFITIYRVSFTLPSALPTLFSCFLFFFPSFFLRLFHAASLARPLARFKPGKWTEAFFIRMLSGNSAAIFKGFMSHALSQNVTISQPDKELWPTGSLDYIKSTLYRHHARHTQIHTHRHINYATVRLEAQTDF